MIIKIQSLSNTFPEVFHNERKGFLISEKSSIIQLLCPALMIDLPLSTCSRRRSINERVLELKMKIKIVFFRIKNLNKKEKIKEIREEKTEIGSHVCGSLEYRSQFRVSESLVVEISNGERIHAR